MFYINFSQLVFRSRFRMSNMRLKLIRSINLNQEVIDLAVEDFDIHTFWLPHFSHWTFDSMCKVIGYAFA